MLCRVTWVAEVVSETVLGVIMGPEMMVPRCRSLYWALHIDANPCESISNDYMNTCVPRKDAGSDTNSQVALDRNSAMSYMCTATSGRQVAHVELRARSCRDCTYAPAGRASWTCHENMCHSHPEGQCSPAVV